MKRIRRALAGAYALLALAGCLNYSMVPPERTTVAGAFSVMPTVAWNKSTLHGDERWTLDGNSLQEIIFLNVGDNQRLMSAVLGGPGLGEPVVRPANDKIPAYLSSMTPYDIKELIEASLAQLGAVDLVSKDFRATKFGSANGFRFEIEFAYRKGLAQKGFVTGAQVNGRLYLIIFTAAATYFHPRDLPEAEAIAASVQLSATATANVLTSAVKP